ncbi:hypothetical protein Bbelb_016130 [Branchiostoma belcheri]|nr:hypothetical protein Bbelb_016130 [Branchiostoma belcheri]
MSKLVLGSNKFEVVAQLLNGQGRHSLSATESRVATVCNRRSNVGRAQVTFRAPSGFRSLSSDVLEVASCAGLRAGVERDRVLLPGILQPAAQRRFVPTCPVACTGDYP